LAELQEGLTMKNGLPISPAQRWQVGTMNQRYVDYWVDWDWQPWIEGWVKELSDVCS
jgi:hypothetical protein